MNNAKTRFNEEMIRIRNLSLISKFLKENKYSEPEHYDELNRTQLVWAVSAFDKLLHELIRVGIKDIFFEKRKPTKKYSNESIPISVMTSIYNKDLISASIEFEQAIYGKLKVLSFQNFQKIADGLSFIWDEGQKWQKLATKLSSSDEEIKKRLNLIVSRRNDIVHEADLDPVSLEKQDIRDEDIIENIDFLENLGNAICDYVIISHTSYKASFP